MVDEEFDVINDLADELAELYPLDGDHDYREDARRIVALVDEIREEIGE
jgi:hypothetical protein